MKSTGARLTELDYAKGIGIIAMIMGHIALNTDIPHEISHYIHVWNMPLFFLVSGYLFADICSIDVKTFCIKRVRSLLIPYFVWGIFSWIFYVAIKYVFQREELGMAIGSIRYVLGYNNVFFPISGALWFLTAMFFVQVLYFCLKKYIGNTLLRMVLIIGIASVVVILSLNENFGLPFSLDSALVALFFFAVGDWAKEMRALERLNSVKKGMMTIWMLGLGVLSVWSSFCNASVNMRTLTFGNPILFFINALVSCLFILVFAKWITLHVSSSVLQYVGQNSIVYLIFNQMILAVLYRLFDKLAIVPEWLEVIVSLVIVVVGCSFLVFILQKMFPWTIGKRKVSK